MKLIIAALLIAGTLANVATCSAREKSPRHEKETTRTVKVGDFNKIDASTGIKVVYSQGPLKLAKVTAPDNLQKYINLTTEFGELNVSIDQSYFDKYNSLNADITVTVSSPNVYKYDVSSGAIVEVNSNLKLHHEVEIDASSGGQVVMPNGVITPKSANIDVSSGAIVKITGINTSQIECDASSGAGIIISGINTSQIECDASSGAKTELTGINSDRVSFDASSGATCIAKGTTKHLKIGASSASSIKASELRAENAKIYATSGSKIYYNAQEADVDVNESCLSVNSAR